MEFEAGFAVSVRAPVAAHALFLALVVTGSFSGTYGHLVWTLRASGMAEGSGRFLRWADRPGACRRAGRNPGQEAGERQQEEVCSWRRA